MADKEYYSAAEVDQLIADAKAEVLEEVSKSIAVTSAQPDPSDVGNTLWLNVMTTDS